MKKIRLKKTDHPEHHLFSAILALNTIDEAKSFFRDLCTPNEIQSMADRWRVVELIQKNNSYRQIAKQTGISVTTVGRVARFVSLGNDGYQMVYKRLTKQKNKR